MRSFFSAEGPLVGFLNKTGQLIIVSVLWILTSLPVVTLGASTAALFYAVTKSVRRGRGYPWKEYLRALRKNLRKGCILSVFFLLFYGGLAAFYFVMLMDQTQTFAAFFGAWLILVLFVTAVVIYVFPVLSRFEQSMGATLRQSVLLAVRYFYFTILLIAGLLLLLWAQFFLLPVPCLLILPGMAMYGASFLLEKTMRPYYPEAGEGEDAWWME